MLAGVLSSTDDRRDVFRDQRLLIDHALDVAGLHRLHLQVFDFNRRAQRTYEKCGFVREGVHRDALYWDGSWHDAIAMAILATDPRPTATTDARRPPGSTDQR